MPTLERFQYEAMKGPTPSEAAGIKVEGEKVANVNPECQQEER
jgi:hypothetical protein